MKFKAYHKRLLTQLALVPCHALIPQAGTIRKTNHTEKTKYKLTQYQITFLAFHGSNVAATAEIVDGSGKQWMSHVKMLCNLTGPFEAMADKDYFATVEVDNNNGNGQQERRVILNLEYLLGVRQELELDANIETVLHLKGLPRVGKANPIYRERPLGEMWTKIYANVRIIMAYEQRYITIHEKLPELGDDDGRHALLDYIWDEMYKEYKYSELKRKEKERDAANNANAADADVDVVIVAGENEDDDGIEGLSPSGLVDVPDDFDPGMWNRSSWQPPAIGVYVAYVCTLTRFTDRYLSLFADNGNPLGDGTLRLTKTKKRSTSTRVATVVTLDESNEVILQGNKRLRGGKETVDAETQTEPPPAMTSEQLKQSANLLLRRSSDERRRLSLAIQKRKEIYDTQVDEEKRSWDMFRTLNNPNLPSLTDREQDPFYKDFVTKREQTQEARDGWKKAIEEENIFCAGDEFANKAYDMLEKRISAEEPTTDKTSNPKITKDATTATAKDDESGSLSQKYATNEDDMTQSVVSTSEKQSSNAPLSVSRDAPRPIQITIVNQNPNAKISRDRNVDM